MKKLVLAMIAMILVMSGCSKKEEEPQVEEVVVETPSADALRFKDEYESLNGSKTISGKEYRVIEIPEVNPIVYATADEVADMIEEGETIFVYFGYASCPWCRSAIPYALEVFKERGIDTVYYVDIHDIRDTMKYDSLKGFAYTDTMGSDGYHRLVSLLDNVLDDYAMEDEEGNSVPTYEKRIYAPNFVLTNAKQGKGKVEGISDLQSDGYMELDDEMIEDMKDSINSLIDLLDACSVVSAC